MKKTFVLGLALYSLTTTLTAHAQTPQHLVKLTGNLDPLYSVQIPDADLKSLADGINGIANLPNIEVNINSIYDNKKDRVAFEAAAREVSRVVLQAAKHLVDMRAIVYMRDISIQRESNDGLRVQMASSYQESFENSFHSMLALFLGTDSTLNPALTDAMEKCFTQACAQTIADAQIDLMNFGKSINYRINFKKATRWDYESYTFQSKFVRDSILRTKDEVLGTNQVDNLYVKMLKVAFSPFAVIASGAAATTTELGNFIADRNVTRINLAADSIDYKSQLKEAQKTFEARFGENFDKIINQRNGAKQYVETPEATASADSSVGSSSSAESLQSISPELSQRLAAIQTQIENSRALGNKSSSALINLLASTLSNVSDPVVAKWVLKTLPQIHATSKNAGMVFHYDHNDTREYLFENNMNLKKFNPYYSQLDIGGGSIQGSWLSLNTGFGGEGEMVKVLVAVTGNHIYFCVPYKSMGAKQYFINYWTLNLSDYMKAGSDGSNVNMNPPPTKWDSSLITE